MKLLKTYSLLLVLVLTVPMLVGCLPESAGVTAACIGYSAGAEGADERLSFENEEKRLVPGEIVRAMALLAAHRAGFSDEKTMARVIFDYDAIYMKAIVQYMGGYYLLLDAMNEYAASCGMKNTVFGSLTGSVKWESDLYAALESVSAEFSESFSTTSDLLMMARQIYENETLSALYGVRAYEFSGESAPKTRNAPLLRPGNDCYLESAVLYVGGTVVDAGGKVTGIALCGVKEGEEIAFSAVAEHSGAEDPIPYMAADGGNLCGKVLGKDYNLNKSPEATDLSGEDGTVFLGTNLFYVIVFLILAAVLALFAVGAVIAFVNTMKRNIEGRKKYAPPKPKDDN
jgi:hypothetical protein